MDGLERQMQGAVAGRQTYIRGDGTAGSLDLAAKLVGVVLQASTTYVFFIPVAGASAVDVTLRCSSFTGTAPTPTMSVTFADGVTVKGTAAPFAILVAGVAQTISITTLRGEKLLKLTIAVPAASTCTIDMAEYNTL